MLIRSFGINKIIEYLLKELLVTIEMSGKLRKIENINQTSVFQALLILYIIKIVLVIFLFFKTYLYQIKKKIDLEREIFLPRIC